VKFNNLYFSINTDNNIVYKSPVNTPIFRFTNLLEAGITAAKNMFDFYGVESPTDPNTKVISINMKVGVNTNDNTVKPKEAKLKINFTLDTSETSWSSLNNKIDINN
jgi:hypothetical protein